MNGLTGKRIVVAGSSQGIGRAVALRLAQEGACVVINGREQEALEQALVQIRAAGGEAIAQVGSVGDYAVAGELVGACVDAYGGIGGFMGADLSQVQAPDMQQSPLTPLPGQLTPVPGQLSGFYTPTPGSLAPVVKSEEKKGGTVHTRLEAEYPDQPHGRRKHRESERLL